MSCTRCRPALLLLKIRPGKSLHLAIARAPGRGHVHRSSARPQLRGLIGAEHKRCPRAHHHGVPLGCHLYNTDVSQQAAQGRCPHATKRRDTSMLLSPLFAPFDLVCSTPSARACSCQRDAPVFPRSPCTSGILLVSLYAVCIGSGARLRTSRQQTLACAAGGHCMMCGAGQFCIAPLSAAAQRARHFPLTELCPENCFSIVGGGSRELGPKGSRHFRLAVCLTRPPDEVYTRSFLVVPILSLRVTRSAISLMAQLTRDPDLSGLSCKRSWPKQDF